MEKKIDPAANIHTMTAEAGAPKVEGGSRGILPILAPYAAIALSLFFAAMWALAVIVKGDWTLGEDTLSELGGSDPSEWIFNSAAIISGVLGILFAAGLNARLRELRTGKTGCVAFALASVCLISVGLLPIDTGTAHGVASVMFFATAALAVMLLLVPIFRMAGAKGAPFITSIAALAVSFAAFVLTPLPFAEATAVSALLAWSLVLGTWMIADRIR